MHRLAGTVITCLLLAVPAMWCLTGAIDAVQAGFRWLWIAGAAACTVGGAALVLWLDDRSQFVDRCQVGTSRFPRRLPR